MRMIRAARALVVLGCFAHTSLDAGIADAQSAGGKAPTRPAASAAPKPAAAASSTPSAKPDAAKPASPKPATKPLSKPSATARAAPPHAPSKSTPTAKKAIHHPPLTRRPGEPGEPDEATRRIISGTSGRSAQRDRAESPELKALRELDQSLFPAAAPRSDALWPSDTVQIDGSAPNVVATGLPPQLEPAPTTEARESDLAWLRQLELPDIPVRWDPRVVRYLEFYKESPRGRALVAGWIKKSGRYGANIRRTLRDQGLPEDILWLSLIESGFDPNATSPAGAAGLWQFMPEGARIYGLTVDRWVDERRDPERSTIAAARFLADLRQRFGTWELAFAAYNMGYGGLLSAIRKYNTNDYWELSRFEAGIPFETSLYVPKIIAMAIAARNPKVFGCEGVELDASVIFDRVSVGPGVSLHAIASAAGVADADIEALNPQLPAHRTPPPYANGPESASTIVRVPPSTGPRVGKLSAKLGSREAKLEPYAVRWGESLDDIAASHHVARSALVALNGIRRDEAITAGTVLLVPATAATATKAPEPSRPTVVVRADTFDYADRRRVFYRPVPGDALRDVAHALSVSVDELVRWNALDPRAALHDGMVLQAYVPRAAKLDRVMVIESPDARVIAAGSDEFFEHFEGQRGRKRIQPVAQEGDTWRSIAKRYGLTLGQLERINQRSRTSALAKGEKVIVYAPLANSVSAALAEREAPNQGDDDGDESAARNDTATNGADSTASAVTP